MRLSPIFLVGLITIPVIGAGLVNGTLSPVPGTGGGGPTNGQTAAQVATQINNSNTTIFASTYIAQQSGTGTNTVLGTLTELNGAYKDLWFGNGAHLVTNTIPPNDWHFDNTNGTHTWGTGSVAKVQLDNLGNMTFPSANGGTVQAKTFIAVQALFAAGTAFKVDQNGVMVNTFMASESGKTNFITIDPSGTLITNDFATFVASLGGGSVPNGLVTNFGTAEVIGPSFTVTNNSGALSSKGNLTSSIVGSLPSGDSGEMLSLIGKTNGNTGSSSGFNANWFINSGGKGGVYLQDGSVLWYTNNATKTFMYSDTNWNVFGGTNGINNYNLNPSNGTITSLALIANGGSVSLIPTNAAPVYTSNGLTAALPFGLTNTLQGRCQYVVGYYRIDAVGGTPILTVSNELDGYKYPVIAVGSSASITPETNWFVTPILSSNVVLRVRDESAGTGASVGLVSSKQIGL